MGKLKIFTWHIHGSYLYYLSQGDFDLFIPYRAEGSDGYIGRGTTFPFGDNVHEVPVEKVKDYAFDCILFQTFKNYQYDQFEILSHEQRNLPKIFLEHDPPQGHPTDTRHIVDDPLVTLVHVTQFNRLMWDNNGVPTRVIDHGVIVPSASYTGELERGVVVINNLSKRGRRLGFDIYNEVKKHVPLDLIGMNTENMDGLGEVLHPDLPDFIRNYRFFFNPIRYTSLGLAVIEAMMIGLPVVGLATTEMVTVFRGDCASLIDTDIDKLIKKMKALLENKEHARRLGAAGKEIAEERFHIRRFTEEWRNVFLSVIREQHQHTVLNVVHH
jgi:glycosyltransferase involved in cell wall biosynthesis